MNYKLETFEQAIFKRVDGKIALLKPTTQKLSLEDLGELDLPNINYNKYFYYKKSVRMCKILHTTYEVEIVDVSLFNDELLKVDSGEIVQYIDNDKIVTELEYYREETDKEFYYRMLIELQNSLSCYDKPHYSKRFYIDGMNDIEKEEYTNIIIHNLKLILEGVRKKLEQLNEPTH